MSDTLNYNPALPESRSLPRRQGAVMAPFISRVITPT